MNHSLGVIRAARVINLDLDDVAPIILAAIRHRVSYLECFYEDRLIVVMLPKRVFEQLIIQPQIFSEDCLRHFLVRFPV